MRQPSCLRLGMESSSVTLPPFQARRLPSGASMSGEKLLFGFDSFLQTFEVYQPVSNQETNGLAKLITIA